MSRRPLRAMETTCRRAERHRRRPLRPTDRLPAAMGLRHLLCTTVCLLSLVAVIGLSACGNQKEPGVDEPAREGLFIKIGGVDYNVYLTRELNLRIPPDSAYYHGKPAAKGHALYGVFLKTCNTSDKPHQ